ncbi:thioesterase [Thecamonas trahens ATCC 50062]|uniref:Thioesterase n=1 Tax=Thecamonas trahens ATCC 50062 TaxID=461836 RepID=A0A0L0DK05_THETB|nr:thioesterase [Thecamonas trahens ATCC 50062]KNC51648.1 thioesterase [Thecamonas trahens ATCC 50062]|eukprot:XP_013755788.1 thioesterase [Thecamonas trahens ATCC 50062]
MSKKKEIFTQLRVPGGEVTESDGVVYAFHHAGGSATSFVPFARAAPRLSWRALQLPGRGVRMSEAHPSSVAGIVGEAVVAMASEMGAGGEYVVFGHSMGATLAYEVVRALMAVGAGNGDGKASGADAELAAAVEEAAAAAGVAMETVCALPMPKALIVSARSAFPVSASPRTW